MNILFIGDIVGKCGRNVITKHLEEIKKKYDIDFTIANGENVTHGRGLIEKHYEDLLSAGVDLVTLGNHYRSKDEIDHYIDSASQLIRPNNLLNYRKGEGYAIMDVDGIGVKVINILGDAFIAEEVSSPFLSIKEALKADEEVTINIVDYHAESTSEKETM